MQNGRASFISPPNSNLSVREFRLCGGDRRRRRLARPFKKGRSKLRKRLFLLLFICVSTEILRKLHVEKHSINLLLSHSERSEESTSAKG